MLKTLDQALAGAIDYIADDVQATVKSVREQGVMRTLGDAVEDAAGMVKTGAGAVITGVVGGNKGPAQISNHAGVSSSYADLCAGPGSRQVGGPGGVVFPYTPPPAGKPNNKATPKFQPGGFAPGIGIQRAATAPMQAGGVQVFANAPAAAPGVPAPGAGGAQFRCPPSAGSAAPYVSTPTPSPPSESSGGKEAPLPGGVLATRFDELRRLDDSNNRCFDCGTANPEWASVSFGIFLCIECGGHHRQMGTHISRVRSCKMDTWTERQLQIFSHSGNRRCGDFFRANGISESLRQQRYHTPAAEWYREAWVKNRVFGRPVPAPPAGVHAGPCVDRQQGAATASAKAKAAPATPPADLLDLGEPQAAAGSAAGNKAAAQTADLLNFGDTPAAPAQQKGVAPVETDLLGVGETASTSAGIPSHNSDLLHLSLTGVAPQEVKAPFNLTVDSTAATTQQAPAAASLTVDFAAPPPQLLPAVGGGGFQAPSPAPAPVSSGNTLAGGAKLVDEPKDEKSNDPFAMALEKWGM